MTHNVSRRRVVVGVDVSLTRTGAALIGDYPSGKGVWSETGAIVTRGTLADTLLIRAKRIDEIADSTVAFALSGTAVPALAAIEGPSLGSASRHGHVWDRAGLWHAIVRGFHAAGIPVVQVAPGTRAKYACGNGRGSKTEVRDGMRAVWPESRASGYDETDALVCAAIAGHALGLPIPEPAPGRAAAALDAVDWSDVAELVGDTPGAAFTL